MNADLAPGHTVPDLCLVDHVGNERRLSELVGGDPLLLHFYRGWWCPKEQAHASFDGYWFWGRPTNEELRQCFRAVTRSIRPDWEVPR